MRTALIGGIGNVLLGDDGVGPYVLRILESQYCFGDDIELVDLGTPSLDLTHQIVGLRALILIDSVASDDAPGTVLLYRKEDILRIIPSERLDPHSPALSECLMTAAMLGASPEHVLLMGIVGAQYEPGQGLSTAVRDSVAKPIAEIVEELQRLGYSCHAKSSPDAPGIWWGEPRDLTAMGAQNRE
ncbi:MAG TPA: hydrogenase maturation protease [Candidatus Sulfotelmatobacter sp.]|nr:hydrogenase maturation protease [Candidatus Sulfotelmatobacter sp.]